MKWFRNLNAQPRLMLSFSVLVLLTLGISYLAINSLSEANKRVGVLYQKDVKGLLLVDDMEIRRFSMGRQSRDAILHIQDPEIVAADKTLLLSQLGRIRTDVDAAENLFYTQEGGTALKTIRDVLPAYEKGCKDLISRVEAKDLAGAMVELETMNGTAKPLYVETEHLRTLKNESSEQKFVANNQSYQSARTLIIIAASVFLILALIISIVIARGFSIPLRKTADVLEQVAAGDLTVSLEVDTKDEVGRMATSLNDALAKVRTTLQEVADSAASASASSRQLASAAESIASGSQTQAASLEETAASLEEITATVRQSADNARQASQLAVGSRDSAERGQEVVSNAVTAMGEINESSAKIFDIISTIDEIAFQTNLLAVNAAVEAARAGEEGRGFAVVASEVRSLAQRSAGAAKEIKVLIQDSLRKVEKGTDLVNKSGETLQGIVTSVKRVTDIVGEIAHASGEQSTGIDQVNTAMTQMDQVTQGNSAQTEELSGTAHSLSEQAARLLELVGTFNLGDNGKDSRHGNLGSNGKDSRHGNPHKAVATQKAKVEVRRPVTAASARSNFRNGNQSIGKAQSKPATPPRAFADSARDAQAPARQAKFNEPAIMSLPASGEMDDSSFEEF